MDFLYDVPAVVLLLAAIAIAIALSALGQRYVHRRFDGRDFIDHNEVGGVIIAVAGTLYAVVLGFLTVVVWEHFLDARQLVVQESNADIDAWHIAAGLPKTVEGQVRADMMRYAGIMSTSEWPAMRRGDSDPEAAIVAMDAINVVATFIPLNDAQSNAQVATLQQLTLMHDARQQRIAVNSHGVSAFEWTILTFGAVCIVCFCWLFGVRSGGVQALMTSAVVVIVVATLVMLFELQFPFRSGVGIDSEAWQSAVQHIGQMQQGAMPGMRM